MAKLSGVTPVNMIDGEITEIKYDGAVYAKVDGQAKMDDIVRNTKSAKDATTGAYYSVITSDDYGDAAIRDDVYEKRSALDGFAVFRKAFETQQASAPCASAPFAEMVMAKVSAVEQKVAAIEAKLAPVNEAPKPRTGDIVVITANTNGSRNKVGDIGKVVGEDRGLKSRKVDVPERGFNGFGNYTRYSEMRLATPAEIAKYESAAVFTKAGRKPNEYRKGDVVRITETDGGHPVGSIGEVDDVPHYWVGENRVAVTIDGKKRDHSSGVEIVCFAENRADAKGAS